jgi:aryl-alcohol dehydrogenase-like predicted oxidoreductase
MKLALGTAQFGMEYGISNVDGKTPQNSIKQILGYANSVGMDTIDTAIAYGNSEHCLGLAGVNGFKVITKLPPIPDGIKNVKNWVSNEIKESLNRLKINQLDAVMLHDPIQLFQASGNELLSALIHLKTSGVVKKIGVSVYDPNAFNELYHLAEFDIVQCPFSIMDQRLVNSGWLDKLKKRGVEVHTRSSFLQGLLLMERNQIPSKFEKWSDFWNAWDKWLKENNISRLRACLSFVLSFEDIDRVVVGVDKKSHLKEIILAAKYKKIEEFPDMNCVNATLINPSMWNTL